MKLVTNHYDHPGDVDSNRVYFRTDDGRAMFEVRAGKDGRSVEVRGIETCKVDGVVYSEQLTVEPRSSNVVIIRTIPWNS